MDRVARAAEDGRHGAGAEQRTMLDQLPQLRCWPEDGGAYIMLPQVYTEDPDRPGLAHSNLGMYRVQISGGLYEANHQAGIHYQLHRGIGAIMRRRSGVKRSCG